MIKNYENIIITEDIKINIIHKTTEPKHERENRYNYLNMLAMHGILLGHTLPSRQDHCLNHFMIKIERKLISAQIATINTSIIDRQVTFLNLQKQKPASASIKTYKC